MNPRAWRDAIRDSELDRTAKLVAHTISTYMNVQGCAWPAKILIAKGAGLGRSEQKGNTAVDNAIDRIEASGLLKVDRKRGRGGFHYTAVIPRGHGGFESLATAGDYDGAKSLADSQEIPLGSAAKSLAESRLIPRPGVGESIESENQSVTTGAGTARKGWIEDLYGYTGARQVYNGRAPHFVYDPLGKDNPRAAGITDWPYPKPTREEIQVALDAQAAKTIASDEPAPQSAPTVQDLNDEIAPKRREPTIDVEHDHEGDLNADLPDHELAPLDPDYLDGVYAELLEDGVA